MSERMIKVGVLKTVVADQNATFHTRDVSEDGRVQRAHPGLVDHRNYHAFVGRALSMHRAVLGIEEIKEKTSRGSLWQKLGGRSGLNAVEQSLVPPNRDRIERDHSVSIGDEKTVGSAPERGGHRYAFNPSDTLGSYEIVRPLGAGGMGEVYLVEHRLMHKRYALKVLPRALFNNAQFVDRFRIEARVMADLQHPHIVQVHHMDEQGGVYYLTMDYVAGPDGNPLGLDGLLKRSGGKLPESTVLELMHQICGALEYAHGFRGKGVVHRDLKPSNILLSQNIAEVGGQRSDNLKSKASSLQPFCVKIADFGLAKVVGGDYLQSVIERSISLSLAPSADRSLGDEKTGDGGTSTRSILGTYEYMSPEQKRGEVVDARTDLYALGIMLYSMLTGRKPEGRWKLPSQLGCSEGWDAVVERCLEPDAIDRFQSVEEMVAVFPDIGTTEYTEYTEEKEEPRINADESGNVDDGDLSSLQNGSAASFVVDEELAAKERKRRREEKEEPRINTGERGNVDGASSSVSEEPRTLPSVAAPTLAHKPVPTEQDAPSTKKIDPENPVIRSKKKSGKGWLVAAGLVVAAGIWFAVGTDRRAVRTAERSGSELGNGTARPAVAPYQKKSAVQPAHSKAATPQERKIWTADLGSGVKMEFMPIAAGSFQMGSNNGGSDEKPVHRVTLSQPFWLAKTEVTNGQYQQFLKESGYDGKADADSDYLRHHRDWAKYASTGFDYPIVAVSWKNAVKFCEWLTRNEQQEGRLPAGFEYTLPTEAQWEYACRARSTSSGQAGTKYCFGEDESKLKDYAWYSSNSESKTHPVGEKQTNAWGLHDMHGNVWEWCSDWYGDYPAGSVTDPTGASSGSGRVFRGGSWGDIASGCRSAFRYGGGPSDAGLILGFRPLVQRR